MILLFFKKLHKFVDPVRPEQMSSVDHSVGPQNEQLMWEMLSKLTLTDLLQLYYHRTSRYICSEFSLEHHIMGHL